MARIVEVALWWAVALGIWLLTLSSVPLPELAVAAASGLVCGVAATMGRRLAAERWRGRARWAAWLLHLPAAVVVESARLFLLAARSAGRPGECGNLQVLQLPPDESDEVAATRRGVGGTVLSATPGTFVVDTRPESRELVVHSIVKTGPKWARVDPSTH